MVFLVIVEEGKREEQGVVLGDLGIWELVLLWLVYFMSPAQFFVGFFVLLVIL